MSQEIAIETQQLSKIYHIYKKPQDRIKQILFKRQCFSEFQALRNVSFQVSRGEVVGIIGRNGSGKSTLLQLLANTLTPTSGHVSVNGRIAAILELGVGFNPDFTGRENVYINAAILGMNRKSIDACFPKIQAFADIGDFMEQPVKAYSSGMMIRLAFAISVHMNAEVLLIDEALAVGDVGFQFKCFERLEYLLAQDATVLLVTHDLQLIKNYCRRALYLKEGTLVYDGDCETATEMYLMDMRTAQQPSASARSINIKKPLNTAKGISFGSQSGEILEARMQTGDTARSYCYSGERAGVTVTAWVSPDVQCPRLVMVLRDDKGYNLFSYDSMMLGGISLTRDAHGLIRGTFRFSCLLQAGNYFLTFRLEDFKSEAMNLLLDKQVAAVTLAVLTKERRFDGIIDLCGEFQPDT